MKVYILIHQIGLNSINKNDIVTDIVGVYKDLNVALSNFNSYIDVLTKNLDNTIIFNSFSEPVDEIKAFASSAFLDNKDAGQNIWVQESFLI